MQQHHMTHALAREREQKPRGAIKFLLLIFWQLNNECHLVKKSDLATLCGRDDESIPVQDLQYCFGIFWMQPPIEVF